MPQAEIGERSSLAKSNGRSSRQPIRAGRQVEIVGERVADDLRLLMDFLLHEMAVVALVDHEDVPSDCWRSRSTAVPSVSKMSTPLRRHHRPVAVLEIGDRIGEGRERNGVGAEEHLALAMADRERRPVAGADDQVVVALEHDGEREGAPQPLQRGVGRLDGICAARQLARRPDGRRPRCRSAW